MGLIPEGSKLSFGTATEDDAAIVAALMTGLNEAVGPSGTRDTTPDDRRVTEAQALARIRAMAPGEEVLLAFIDDEPAGLLSLRIVPYLSQDVPYAEVTELYVTPPCRRHGVAMVLMAEAEFRARRRGATAIRVVAWHDNGGAHAFYRTLGYDALEVAFTKFLAPKSSSRKRRAEG